MPNLSLNPTQDTMFFADQHWEDLVENAPLYEQCDVLPEYFAAPIFVLWELTGKCPLKCMYCYVSCPKKTEDLPEEEIWRVANELVRTKVFMVCLSGGEPTIHPLYLELLSYLSHSGVTIGTVTSGWSMTPRLAQAIRAHTNSVQVSIDGPNASIHDTVRGRAGSFSRAVAAVKMLQDAGVERIHVAFAPTRYSADLLPEMIDLCAELGVATLRTQHLAAVGSVALYPECEPTADQYERLLRAITAHAKSGSKQPVIQWGDPSLHMHVGLALGRTFGARITSEGDAGFTPYLDWSFGSVRRQSLSLIWERGLRSAWRHPLVRERVSRIKGPLDLRAVPNYPLRVEIA
ncbi:MAG: radical SAM protein [bacterium]|nr:radical SAM protein [bacterium]